MKIYLLLNWDNYEYASFSHVGTWSHETIYCNHCEFSDQKLVDPLLIEWEPDSDIIGDFSWCGYTMIVSEKVKNFFILNSFECDFSEVVIKKPTTRPKGRKIVPYPYKGPRLYWVKPTLRVEVDTEKSGISIDTECDKCNHTEFKFKMNGLFIPKPNINHHKMFRISAFGRSAATYMTEEAISSITSNNFTNFHFQEAGISK